MMDEKRDQEMHLTTEQLLDYIERRLSSEEVKRVEAHLATDCSSCQEELAWLTKTLNLMVSDVWIDAPARLQTSARRIYREQFASEPEGFSISQWLQAFFAPRRRLVYAAVGILIVVVVAGLLLQPWLTPDSEGTAEIAAYSGTVEIQTVGSDSWQPAENQGTLKAGDDIRTADGSSAVLSYPDQSRTLLEPRTELRILNMSLDRDRGDQVIVLEQHAGRTRNEVMPLQTAGSRFEIRTPAATITVRGTAFSVDVEADGKTSVSVSEGLVQVAAQGITVALEAGQMTEVESGGTPSLIQPAPEAPNPAEIMTLVSTPASSATEEPTVGLTATPTVQRSETATATPTPLAVGATETPTPTPNSGSSPGPQPTERPQSTDTPVPTFTPAATSTPTPIPPEPTSTEPPPPTPTEFVPPGQAKKTETPTPKPPPPGQTGTRPSSG